MKQNIKITPVKSSSHKYRVCGDYDLCGVYVPDGYEFDGASIPRLFWGVIGCPFNPRFVKASLYHDICYSGLFKIDRLYADIGLRAMLRKAGVSRWRSYLMYGGVRAFGWLFFKKQKKPR